MCVYIYMKNQTINSAHLDFSDSLSSISSRKERFRLLSIFAQFYELLSKKYREGVLKGNRLRLPATDGALACSCSESIQSFILFIS